MNTSRPKLRPLLPKTPSMTRPEPFLLKVTSSNGAASTQQSIKPQIGYDNSVDAAIAKAYGRRRSLGQKRWRERESKENKNQRNCYITEGPRMFDLGLKLYGGGLKKERGASKLIRIVILLKPWILHLTMNMM
ncbi:hypothetical protein C8R44DRAFT_736954 [Mycena epipterygia]|nr:hypothetical protein C8R44DRAFT_736954 [Mycena epipterygia]